MSTFFAWKMSCSAVDIVDHLRIKEGTESMWESCVSCRSFLCEVVKKRCGSRRSNPSITRIAREKRGRRRHPEVWRWAEVSRSSFSWVGEAKTGRTKKQIKSGQRGRSLSYVMDRGTRNLERLCEGVVFPGKLMKNHRRIWILIL